MIFSGTNLSLDALGASPVYVVGDAVSDATIAQAGTWSVTFTGANGSGEVKDIATNTFKVVNNIKAPVVTISSRKIGSTDLDSLKEVASVNFDMNNNDADDASLIGWTVKNRQSGETFPTTGTVTYDASSSDKQTIKYAQVSTNYWAAVNGGTAGDADDLIFYVPVNQTFTVG
jgi:hypothetical protein